ncbi:MAG: hypothetical protein WCR02_13245, partial [Sphaerochaetaceae bacterium]
ASLRFSIFSRFIPQIVVIFALSVNLVSSSGTCVREKPPHRSIAIKDQNRGQVCNQGTSP